MRGRAGGFGCIVASAIALLALPATAAASDGISTERSSATGELSFVRTAPGVTLERPAGLAADAGVRATALAYADVYARRFGAGGPGSELRVASSSASERGGSTVRLQQYLDGLPVIGGELVVNLDGERRASSLSGEAEPEAPNSTDPKVGEAEAAKTAIAATARAHEVEPGALEASNGELSISDPRILGGPGLGRPTLVWRFEVTDRSPATTIRELVLVDATLGFVDTQFSEIETAKSRFVCDAGNTESRVPCQAPYNRTETSGATGNADIDHAFDYAGDTYDFFATLGRDSVDGAGLPLVSTTDYCKNTEPCPFRNAFWSGQQMVYGDGFPLADDIVGHELTHGVTEFSSHLFYYYQSGAINESLSDVFGEFVDLTNGSGSDTGPDRWLIGEDVPFNFNVCGSDPHALRNMRNPADCGHPDRMQSPNYAFDPNTDFNTGDSGGVHTNSGVNNKAAFLITDGGSFNGHNVSGLGINKVKRIYYRVDNALLTSASDYRDLAAALRQSCSDLVGTAGITAADCAQVNQALLATQMDQVPAAAPTVDLPACDDPASAPDNAYFEDFERPAFVFADWAPSVRVGSSPWNYPPGSFTYATSGTNNLWGYDQPTASDTDIAMQFGVKVPAGGMLRFQHANGFDQFGGVAYDGGVVEYSTDGGTSWHDLGPMITRGGYNGKISTVTDPLNGRLAFVGESAGYRTTRANLASLAGRRVRLRFRIGTDASFDDFGWFIDDVQIYACRNAVPPETRIKGKTKRRIKTRKRKAKVTVRFTGVDDATPKRKLHFQCKVGRHHYRRCSSPARFKLKAKRGKGRRYKIKVRAVDGAGNKDPSPAKLKVKVKRRRH